MHVSCGDQTRPSVGVLGRHSGVVFLFTPTAPEVFCRTVQADFLPGFLCWFPDTFFVTRATLSMYLKAHTSANAVVALLSRNGLEPIPCSCSLFPLSVRLRVCCVHNHVLIVHGSSEQAFGDLPRCPVQKRIVSFVLALVHGPACCPHLLLVGLF